MNNENKNEVMDTVSKVIFDVKWEMCKDFCKYSESWDEANQKCDYIKAHGCCPLDRL